MQTLSAQIGWSHHQVLLDAWADQPELSRWYAAKAAENRWSVRQLQGQIALRLHERQGAAVTNFAAALQPDDADQALQATKDPYVFDFLELGEDAQERNPEQALIADIQNFLLELGTGFAFYGRQRALLVGDQEFFLDLLFYHHALRRFVVIELKIGKFPARVRLEDELLPQRRRRAAAPRRRPRERRDHPLRRSRRDRCKARAAPRLRADRRLDLKAGTAPPELPAVEITDEVPADLGDLSELDTVRTRLIERVVRRTPEIAAGDD